MDVCVSWRGVNRTLWVRHEPLAVTGFDWRLGLSNQTRQLILIAIAMLLLLLLLEDWHLLQQLQCLVQALPHIHAPHAVKQPQHVVCVVAVVQDGSPLRVDDCCHKAYKQLQVWLLVRLQTAAAAAVCTASRRLAAALATVCADGGGVLATAAAAAICWCNQLHCC